MTPEQDAKLIADAKLPHDAQVERAAKLMCIAHGYKVENWPDFKSNARDILVCMQNETAIILGVFP